VTDQTHVEEEYEEVGLGRYIAIGAVVAVVVAAAAFFAGKATAGSSGPATLADAVTQAQKGTLPCGASARATPPANATPGAGGFAGGGRPNADFLVAAVCDRGGGNGFIQRTRTGAGGGFRGGFGLGGPGAVAGTLKSVNGSTLTIQGRQGTQTVKLGSSAPVRKYATGSASDLKAGQTVIVSGGQNGAPQTVTVVPAGQGRQ
jgi:hypothetical protein